MDATPGQVKLLEQHFRLVIEANKRTNITRIDTWEQGWLLHVEDSLLALPEIWDAPHGPLVDLGSGAGFPGIPLAITTGFDVSLVESVGKKAELLRDFAAALGLGGHIRVFPCRAEQLAREDGASYSVVTARALSSLPSLMELASPLLIHGGRLICYKSCDIDDELEWALRLQDKLAMRFMDKRDAVLSDGITRRSIVVFEKDGEPMVNLPRREGQAQRKPYKN